jgi:hypothetical protein
VSSEGEEPVDHRTLLVLEDAQVTVMKGLGEFRRRRDRVRAAVGDPLRKTLGAQEVDAAVAGSRSGRTAAAALFPGG